VPVTQPHPALRVVRDGPPEDVPAAQGTLALALPPIGVGDGGDPTDDSAARRPSGGPTLPEPGQWAAQFVQAAVEVTSGMRPSSQLLRWTSDEVRGTLTRRAELARQTVLQGRRLRRSVVRSTRVCLLRDGVAEACVMVTDGTRVRAVALRLEGLDGRWRVTALQIG
jgi:hypothetical protein